MRKTLLLALSVAMPLVVQPARAQSGNKLEYVAVLGRHGVRSPMIATEKLSEYSAQPWHKASVPVQNLTEHGRKEMEMVGTWTRQFLMRGGLLSGAPGCDEASRFHLHADQIQRDIESARAMAGTMFPGCTPSIYSEPEKTPDPMFLGTNAAGLDPELAGAAMEGRTGGNPTKILKAHASDVEIVQKILTGNGPAPAKSLTTLTPSKGDRYARNIDPLTPINYLTDALILEYEEGYPAAETGWGRLNETNLPALMILQEAFVDMVWDNPVTARARGSNLLAHMMRSMQQAVSGHPVEGAMGKVGDRGLFVMGHDSDFGHFATLLNLSWMMDGFPPKATQPGASMIFEIWRDDAGRRTVRLSIEGQSIKDIHDGVAPSAEHPPLRAAIFVPGCSAVTEGYPCEFEAFRKVVDAAIDSTYVRPEPEALR